MEVEVGVVGEGVHCMRAVIVATFLASCKAAGVHALIELNIVGFTTRTASTKHFSITFITKVGD